MRIAYIIKTSKGIPVARAGQYVTGPMGEDEGTINQAEYIALIHALRHAIRLGFTEARCTLDSQLVVRQLSGLYKTRDPMLYKLSKELKKIKTCFTGVEVSWVGREQNKDADRLTHLSVYQEVTPPGQEKSLGRYPRKLPTWLAARIRRWFHHNEAMDQGMVSRATGIDLTSLRQLLKEQTYRGASEANPPDWNAYDPSLGPLPPPSPLSVAPTGPAEASVDDGTGWPDKDDLDELIGDTDPVLEAL